MPPHRERDKLEIIYIMLGDESVHVTAEDFSRICRCAAGALESLPDQLPNEARVAKIARRLHTDTEHRMSYGLSQTFRDGPLVLK